MHLLHANSVGSLRDLASKLMPQAVLRWQGGEEAALERLRHYIWGSGAVASYFETRNGAFAC